ncbi:MAG: sensor histidine kinase [Chloroflexota bacterium]
MRLPAFTRTIRFRLTLWYAGLLVLFGMLFIIAVYLPMHRSFAAAPLIWPPGMHDPQSPIEIARLVRSVHLQMLRTSSLISLAGLIVFGTIGGYLLSRRMLKPVDRLSSLAARISSTNLKERINYYGGDDEIKRLADTFDDMLGRLEHAFEAQKQFIQDASHELRTPIAIAQTNIEVTEMQEKVTARDYRRLMEVLKPALERMSRLCDNLSLLSERVQERSRLSPVDVKSLLEEVVAEAAAEAKAAGLTIELAAPVDDAVVMGDALRLRQALVNLVDNAIKYNNPGGWVRISARHGDDQLTIEVADSGVGLSQADRARVFQRFYRVDKSRSRSQGGSGLGLSIVKKVVEDHGGTVSVESTLGEGSAFRIHLPIQRTS